MYKYLGGVTWYSVKFSAPFFCFTHFSNISKRLFTTLWQHSTDYRTVEFQQTISSIALYCTVYLNKSLRCFFRFQHTTRLFPSYQLMYFMVFLMFSETSKMAALSKCCRIFWKPRPWCSSCRTAGKGAGSSPFHRTGPPHQVQHRPQT